MEKVEAVKKGLIKQSQEAAKLLGSLDKFYEQLMAVAEHINEAFYNGKKILVAGNGGSAAQAQHLSDEMVGRYKSNRRPYPVVALGSDGAVLTCIGNDFGFEKVFSRQVEALGQEGDIFIGLSTSGNSKNILLAAEAARQHGMTVIALTGESGKLREVADYSIEIPSTETARIQEMHLHAIHLLCEIFEDPSLLPGKFHESPEVTLQ